MAENNENFQLISESCNFALQMFEKIISYNENENLVKRDFIQSQKELSLEKMKHNLEIERINCEKIRIEAQKEILSTLIDTSYKVFDKKIDFYKNEMQNIYNFFTPQIASLYKIINDLQIEKTRVYGNTDAYVTISQEISTYSKIVNNINGKYENLVSEINKTIKELEINLSYSPINYLP